MINEFHNLFRFVDPEDSAAMPKSFHAPKGKLTPLPCNHADSLRFLIPKSDLKGLSPNGVRVGLVSCTDSVYTIVNNQIGTIRVQDSENYTRLKVVVKKAPAQGDYRQLALVRPNGVIALGTFISQQTDLNLYCSELKAFWESYPHANVFVEQNGNLLTVKIYHSSFFHLENEVLNIGVGQVIDYNENEPSITAKKINTVTNPAKDCYPVIVGDDVREGNIFSAAGVTYQALASDTAASVLAKLLGDTDCILVPAGDAVSVSALPGSRTVKNSVKPIVNKTEQSSDATYTYWRISVQGTITPGNYIEVSASGATSVRLTVLATDTIATLETLLNPNSTSGGTFRANNGAAVIITVLAGVQQEENTNLPQISLGEKEVIPLNEVDRYQISVGSSVSEGNIFKLKDLTYTAKFNDTNDQVALALGGDQSVFVIEIPEDELFECYAVPGKKYNTRHAADATIIEQPVIRRSQQYVCEMRIPTNKTGYFHAAIINQDTNEIELISNALFIRDSHRQTSFVEIGGRQEFGYEYYEDMLTQRARLPLYLMRPKNSVDGSFGSQLGGSSIKMNTRIVASREFVTTALTEESANAFTTWIQHRRLKINDEDYLQTGNYDEEVISEGLGLKQLSGALQSLKEKSNFPELLQGFYNYSYGSAIIYGTGLQIFMQTGSFVRRLSSEWQLLNVADYEVFLQTGPDNVLLSIYRNGTFEKSVLVRKNSRSKISSFLRLGAHERLMFYINLSTEFTTIEYEEQQIETVAENVQYIAEKAQKYLYNQFNNDFNSDFKTGSDFNNYSDEYSDEYENT